MAGKVLAMTGASSGLGEATTIHLAAQGAKVALGARGEERPSAAAGRITSEGGYAAYARPT